jgi:two-component sensor histidine kinase
MKAIFSFVILFLFVLKTGAQIFSVSEQKTIDSLSYLTKSAFHDSVRADAYIKLSVILYVSNFDTLFFLSQKADEISKQNLQKELSTAERKTFLRISSEANNNMGYYHQALGDYETAMNYYAYCLETDKRIGNMAGLSGSFNNMGMIYNYQGNILKSLDYFLLALKIDESLGDDVELGPSLNNIAYVYEHQNDTNKALQYYERARIEFENSGDHYSEAAVLINLGSIAKKRGDHNLANNYFNQSLNTYRKLGNKDGEGTALLSLGNLLFEIGEIDSAKNNLNICLQISLENGDKQSASIALINLGNCFLKQNDLENALDYGERAFALARETGHVYNIKNASELLSQIYKQKNMFEQSLEMYQMSISMRDSMQNRQTERATYQKGLTYQYEKEQALKEAEYAKMIAVEQLKQQNQLILIILISTILLLIVIFALVSINRLKKTKIQKQIIEEKNAENELLLGEIHHRVKNNLQVIASLLSLQEKSVTDTEAKKAILEGKERVNSMGLIHKLLYQNDRFAGIEMNEYIQKLLEGLMNSFGYDRSKLQLDIAFPEIKLDVDSAVPIGLIINELVINAFKYAYENIESPELKIKLQNRGEHLLLEIKDNGKGQPDDISKSNSFGFKLVKSLVRQIKGEMVVTAQMGLNYSIEIRDFKLMKG